MKINETIKEEDILAVTVKAQVVVIFMQTAEEEFNRSEIFALKSKIHKVKIGIIKSLSCIFSYSDWQNSHFIP